ncbi:MAG: CDP-diacylglycerol--glycerol-3-phosphate 3-phosphatidyltransferase [Chlamydiota bacterium]
MTVANYLTFMRIFISPIFLLIYVIHDDIGISPIALPYILILLMGISELSDALDGYFARRYNQVTDLGKILDPMADSIYRISIFLSFTQPPVNLPILLVFIFIYRDSVISTLRTVCALRGYALAARISGKMKAIFQAIIAFIILFMMIPQSMGFMSDSDLRSYSTWIVSVIAVYAIFSGLDYIYANRHYLKKLLTHPES